MKVVSTDALTKLIQLIKSAFIAKTDVEQTSEVTLATVATSGSYNDLTNKPNDSDFVHTSGDETISGEKTLTNILKINESIRETRTDLTKGTAPDDTYYLGLIYDDGSPYPSGQNFNNENRFGLFETSVQTDGSVSTYMCAYKNTSNVSTNSRIGITYPLSGNPYTDAPTPTDTTTTSGNQIATTGWVNSVGNNVVHLNNAEIITGTKTFVGGYGAVILKESSNTTYVDLEFDKNDSTRIGSLRAWNNGYMSFVAASYVTAPASDVDGSILTTVNKSKANNGYYKLGNGLILNWGQISSFTVAAGAVSSQTVTFSCAYTAVPKVITTIINNATNVKYGDSTAGVGSTSTTGCTVCYANNSNGQQSPQVMWFAIGY